MVGRVSLAGVGHLVTLVQDSQDLVELLVGLVFLVGVVLVVGLDYQDIVEAE